MTFQGEVILKQDGRQYGATYTVAHGMLHVKTHTETRSVKLEGRDPAALARNVLGEIVESQAAKS